MFLSDVYRGAWFVPAPVPAVTSYGLIGDSCCFFIIFLKNCFCLIAVWPPSTCCLFNMSLADLSSKRSTHPGEMFFFGRL